MTPDLPRLGESVRPAQDSVRLGQQPSLAFAPRTIAAVSKPKRSAVDTGRVEPERIDVFSFGLFGPNGPLPLHLTEYAFSRMNNDHDETLARFADMFHHRMLSFFYRGWALSEPTVSHDRKESDVFAQSIASLAGFGMPSLHRRDGMPDLVKTHFTGRLASHTRNAEGLQAILSSYFDVPITIREFVPNWVPLPQNSLCQLGKDPRTGVMGSTLTVGTRVRVFHHRFRIVVGPMPFAAYERLLPGGDTLNTLVSIVRNYIGDELEFEYNLVLQRREVPKLKLGGNGRLGWTSWLGTRREPSDARDLLKVATPTMHSSAAARKPATAAEWSNA
jgi:type VI secretion system protein ImpH